MLKGRSMSRIQVWLEADALYESKSGLFYYSPTYSSVSRDMSLGYFLVPIQLSKTLIWYFGGQGRRAKLSPLKTKPANNIRMGFMEIC